MGRMSIQTIEEYISQFPDEVQRKLIALRKIVNQTAPSATEKLAWGVPTYYQRGFLVEFAVNKNHIGFYCTPSTISSFNRELGRYKTGMKNMIQLPLDEELPVELLEKMIRFRLKENGS